MKIPFAKPAVQAANRIPERPADSVLKSVTVGALYRGARKGGDYYDYISTGPRMLLLLLDIAGRRDEALAIAAEVQHTFRAAADLFGIDDVNESVALSQLQLEINRAIMAAAGGVRCAPGILASYNEVAGTLWYINAGHTAPIMKDSNGAQILSESGVPLGLFSHATQDSNICVMPEGSALVMVSRGLVEAKAGGEEYGLERARRAVAEAPLANAQQLCTAVHESVRGFIESRPKHKLLPGSPRTVGEEDPFGSNDATALALVRHAVSRASAG
jgi:sigma-B regulation protein RsbU (phosphoserine phosphatase)